MNIFSSRNVWLTILACLITTATLVARQSTAPKSPNPVLVFRGQEYVEAGGKKKTRYQFEVTNKKEYPAEMFAAAPELPPCGENKKASRTWVEIYDQHGKRLNGFCALGKPDDLSHLWFVLDQEQVPPSWVYIEMVDRKTNMKYKSNLAETTL